MKTYSRLTLTFLLLILVVPQVSADEPPEAQRDDRFAVGSTLSNPRFPRLAEPDHPKTFNFDYPRLIEITAGEGGAFHLQEAQRRHRGLCRGTKVRQRQGL